MADRGSLTGETDAAGNVTQYTFDPNGNPTGVTRVEQCTISSSIATESFGSLLMYDVMNQLVVRADQGADGTLSGNFSDTSTLFTFHGYNSRGLETNIIDPKQNTTIMVFDGAGRQLQIQQNLRTGGSGSNPIVSTVLTQYGFDGNGNQIRLVDSNSGTTTWAFDTLDRRVSETYQDGSSKEFVYDLASDVVTYTDENGSVFSNTWDCMGRKIDIAITPVGALGTTAQSFQYNGLAQTTFARDTANGNNADVTLVYDSIQRTVEEAQAFGGNTRYVTNDGFTSLPVSQFTYPNARQVNNSFDALYRRQQIIEAATSAVIANWQYFGPSRIATVALGNGIIQTMLNNARTHSAVQYNTVPNPAWGTPSSDRLGYDGSGRMIAKRYLAGGINSGTYAYSNTTPVVGNTTAFDPADNKFYERALHAESRSFLYQPVSAVGAIASPVPGYDSINRLLQYQRGTLSGTGGYQNTGGGSITSPNGLPGTKAQENWNLDGLGNWRATGFIPVGGSQTTDQRNHNYLNEIAQLTTTGQAPYTPRYDLNGNTIAAATSNLSPVTLVYDALNRPIQINRASGGAVIGSYVFDAFNRRIRKATSNGGLAGNVPNETTDNLWQGWSRRAGISAGGALAGERLQQVVEERDPFGGTGSTDTPVRQYVWGTYIDELIQLTTYTILGPQSLPAGAYYLLQDLLYRAVALTNSAGAVVEAYDTDAYGNTLIFTGPGADGVWFRDDDAQSSYGANEIIYCGYRYDPETELYYVRNRTYGPVLGRWLQRDPIGYAGGVNLYEYVGGRAVAALDPTGLACFVPCASFAAALITFWLACDTATGACPASVVPEPGEPAVLGACITAILAAIAAFIAADAAGVDCVKCLKKDCHPNKARNTQQQIEQMQQEIDKLEAELKKLEGH